MRRVKPLATLLVLTFLTSGCSAAGPTNELRSLTVGHTTRGQAYGCVVDLSGSVWCWDQSGDPEVYGFDPGRPEPMTPVRVRGLPPAQLVRAGFGRVWASTDAGLFWWGSAPIGFDAGCEDWCAPRRFDGIGSVSALALSGDAACGLVGDDVWCWGSSAYGEVGLVTDEDAQRWRWFAPRERLSGATRLASRYGSMCATLVDGGVTCWGGGSAALVPRDLIVATEWSNGCVLTPKQTLFCDGAAALARGAGAKLLGRRDGTFNIGNCAVTTGDDVWCWEWDSARPWAGRVFPEFKGAVELAMAPLPEELNPRTFHACALLSSDAVRCAPVRTDGGVIEVFPPRR